MRRPYLKLIHCIVIAALFAGSGAQWFMLQSVAWTEMLIRYSQETTLTDAVGKTFDGEHPCPLCLRVAKADTKQTLGDATAPSWESIKGVLCRATVARQPAWQRFDYPAFMAQAPARFALPLTPPPRAAAAA